MVNRFLNKCQGNSLGKGKIFSINLHWNIWLSIWGKKSINPSQYTKNSLKWIIDMKVNAQL